MHVGPGDADDRRELDLDGHVPPGAVADAVGGHAVVHAAVLLLDVVDHQHVTAAGEDRGQGQVTMQIKSKFHTKVSSKLARLGWRT